ncbi:MAG: PIN domain-containing protein [Bacteroidetes bacterium]|jgi:predicted nucleic acid-binding protein|nr:PIN domain-containing protein [Bacteroidota bacterium]
MSRILIDTNIFIYGIDEDSNFFKRARKILDQKENQLVTTSKNLVEFLSVVTRSSGYDLSNDVALNITEEIIQGVDVMYPTQESTAILLDLISRYQPKGLKIHDFEMISIGLANGLQEVATFNEKDFGYVEEIKLFKV